MWRILHEAHPMNCTRCGLQKRRLGPFHGAIPEGGVPSLFGSQRGAAMYAWSTFPTPPCHCLLMEVSVDQSRPWLSLSVCVQCSCCPGAQTVQGAVLFLPTLDCVFFTLDSGHLALLSPSCRLPVASLSLFWHFQPPVAPLLLACRFPVAVLSFPCRSPVASLSLSSRPPVSILSLPVASYRFLSPCYFLPAAFLSLSCPSPVVPSRRSPVAISCYLPVALLSLACRLPAASLSPASRLPVASLSPNVVTCRSPVACLSLACRLPVVFLPPPCRLPVAQRGNLSLSCRLPVACLSLA